MAGIVSRQAEGEESGKAARDRSAIASKTCASAFHVVSTRDHTKVDGIGR
jgi:hypothetical protein